MAELFSSTPYAALTARERIWAAIREMKTVTVREVADRCDAKADAVRGYFTGLVAAGVLDVIHRGTGGKHSVYTLKRDLGVHAPRVRKDGTFLPDSVRSRLWNAMPIFGVFTARDLAMSTTLAESPVSRAEALDYCRWLAQAGYLRDLGDEKFRFIPARHTGVKAPQIVRVTQVYDPNIDKGGTTNDEPREGRGRLGRAAPGLDREAGHGLRRQGAAEDCGGSFRLPGHCEPRHSARPRKARLYPGSRRAPSRNFHHPLPRARAHQPEGVPGQPAKAVFIHQPHRGAAFPVMPGILPVQRTQKGGTP